MARKKAVPVKPFTWIVRFDVAPLWVADGFDLDDARAFEMLSTELSFADCNTEIAAKVISAPDTSRIRAEQGYQDKDDSGIDNGAIRQSIIDAIDYLKSDGKSSALVASLKQSLELLDGTASISEIEWQVTPD